MLTSHHVQQNGCTAESSIEEKTNVLWIIVLTIFGALTIFVFGGKEVRGNTKYKENKITKRVQNCKNIVTLILEMLASSSVFQTEQCAAVLRVLSTGS